MFCLSMPNPLSPGYVGFSFEKLTHPLRDTAYFDAKAPRDRFHWSPILPSHLDQTTRLFWCQSTFVFHNLGFVEIDPLTKLCLSDEVEDFHKLNPVDSCLVSSL